MEYRWKRLLIAGILAAVLMVSWKQDVVMRTAWWGTLYPEYCYSQIPEEADGEQVQIRIKFRWLHGF
ncbi:MAG: hypothetical protein Q4F24_14885 [Eubacteriales bacterium]|nr:hypothetical protein [Eubacteriales bacterium]